MSRSMLLVGLMVAMQGSVSTFVVHPNHGHLQKVLHSGQATTCQSRTTFHQLIAERSSVRLEAKKKKSGDVEVSNKRKEKQLIDDIRSLVDRVGIGFDASEQEISEMDGMLAELEEFNAVENPTRSAKLWGRWELVFTNSPAMLKNRGLTGFGSFPFVKFKSIIQTLSSTGKAETEEVLLMPVTGAPVTSFLSGNITVVNQQVFEQSYENVNLASMLQAQSQIVGSGVYFSKAVLAITYLTEDFRVCRSPSGAFFLFRRCK